jgi:hypothetical protein
MRMIKSFILLCCLIAGVFLCGFQQGTSPQIGKSDQKNSQSSQKTRHKEANQHGSTAGKSSPDESDKEDQGEDGHNYQNVQIITPEKAIDHIEHGISLFTAACTFVLTIAAVCGILYSRRTLNDLIIQTKATEKAAKAAELNAQVMIDTERALIEIDLSAADSHRDEFGEEVPGYDHQEVFRFGIQITNHGRTVARVINYKIWHGYSAQNFDKNKLTSFGQIPTHMLLGAGKSIIVGNIDADDCFSDWLIMRDSSRGFIRIDVQYADVIQTEGVKPHETSVVYIFDGSLEEPERLDDYNTYT